MNEKGVQPPTGALQQRLMTISTELWQWVASVTNGLPRMQTYTPTIDPASVSASSESVQTFTVSGLSVRDQVSVDKPSDTAGLLLAQAWVSATDTLSLKFYNHTGSPIDPPSETYRITAVRR